MGNSSTSFLPNYSCSDNLSKDSITPEYWGSFDIIEDSISKDIRNGVVVIGVISLLFLLIGLPANLAVIVIIVQQKMYKESTHILLLNLAISDFLQCFLLLPFLFVAAFSEEFIFGNSDYTRCQVCQMVGSLATVSSLISVHTLCWLSVDRLIFVKFPLHYDRYVTTPRVIIIVVLAWIVSLAVAFIPLSGFGEIRYFYTISTCSLRFDGQLDNILYAAIIVIFPALLAVLITVAANIWIACIAGGHIREVYSLRNEEPDSVENKRFKAIKKEKQFRLVGVFGAIVIGNFLCWSPICIFTIVLAISQDEDVIPLGVFIMGYLSIYMRSLLNPLIESCFIPEIKTAVKKIFKVVSAYYYSEEKDI